MSCFHIFIFFVSLRFSIIWSSYPSPQISHLLLISLICRDTIILASSTCWYRFDYHHWSRIMLILIILSLSCFLCCSSLWFYCASDCHYHTSFHQPFCHWSTIRDAKNTFNLKKSLKSNQTNYSTYEIPKWRLYLQSTLILLSLSSTFFLGFLFAAKNSLSPPTPPVKIDFYVTL